MKLKKDNEAEISFEEFYKEFLMKINILFLESNDSFAMCTPSGEFKCEIDIIYDSPEEKEEFIKYVKSKSYETYE